MFDLAKLKLPDLEPELDPRDFFVVTHPLNALLLVGAWQDRPEHVENVLKRGMQIHFNEMIEQHSIVETWNPPFGGKFTSYSHEDEHWMRPLRIGRFETCKRPLFYLVRVGTPFSPFKPFEFHAHN